MNGPIDSGTVSARTAAVLALGAISVGMLWQDVKADIGDHEKRVAVLEQQLTRNGNTLAAICETLQCQRKGIEK